MPYFIRTTRKPVLFPDLCSSCGRGGILMTYSDDHSQATGVIPLPGLVQITSRRTELDFPMCPDCVGRGARLKLRAFGLMFLPWIGACVGPHFADDRETQGTIALAACAFALACAVGGVVLLVYAHRGRRNLKMVYAGPDEIVFSSRSRDYAGKFAALNDTVAEERAFYVRLR